MTILHVILAIILLVAALLLFVLLSPLSLRIVYQDGVVVKAGLSFIKIKVFPKKEKKEKKKKDKKEHKKNKEEPKSSHVFETDEKNGESENTVSKKKSSIKDTVILVYDIIKSVFEMFGKHAKIRIDVLKVTVAKADAADTAIQFGLCSGIVTSLLAFTSNFGKSEIKDKNVRVEPDFISGKSRIELDITLSAKVIFILASLIRGYFKNQLR